MGLYLCIIENGEDFDGIDIGSYADFNAFRNYIVNELEDNQAGKYFPLLILHSDSDGEWSVDQCIGLREEITIISNRLKLLPPIPFCSEWQKAVAKTNGFMPKSAYESFIDIDGDFLIERLLRLVSQAIDHKTPILFQ